MDRALIDAKTSLQDLQEKHIQQRKQIEKIQKSSKRSVVWLLEGLSLSVLNRAIKQIEANDVVAYELAAKVRLSQEACLMVQYLSQDNVKGDAARAWGKALAYYFSDKSEIKYRQFKKDPVIFDEVQRSLNDTLSAWCHASYDNARTAFMYLNNDKNVYEINYVRDNDIYYTNYQDLTRIDSYTNKTFDFASSLFGQSRQQHGQL